MKAKSQRKSKRESDGQQHAQPQQKPNPLRIKFNLSNDSIACFLGQKENSQNKNTKVAFSLKKSKADTRQPPKNIKNQHMGDACKIQSVILESEEVLQASLSAILGESQAKQMQHEWKNNQQGACSVCEVAPELENSYIWTQFSQNSSLKSYASTVEPTPNYNYSTGYPLSQYYYDYGFQQLSESISFQQRVQPNSQFQIQQEYINADSRTTVMIRNIPNKYTVHDLSDEIDDLLKNSYDFLYLPCDLKNLCNVGYGFINFISTEHLLRFYQLFQGKRWLSFRSEKICHLTYARLQGLSSLIEHFENSKVLNQKDKKYRPIIHKNINHLIKTQQEV